MSERAIRRFVPGFMLFCFVFGFSRWITYQVEIFPFSAWGMFHRIDKVFNDFDLVLHRRGQQRFDPPAPASDPDNPAGLVRSGQARLLMNGFVRLTERGQEAEAARYREFIEREIVGPDAEYEIQLVLERSRPHEYHLMGRKSFGPFVTGADQPPPTPGARFAFPDEGNAKFAKKRNPNKRRTKRKRDAS
ncbi:MAG: hypothetical protein ACQGVC_08355 [Myxococcota bacterium]